MTIRITFSDLFTHGYDANGEQQRVPLSWLEHDGEIGHVHGRFEMMIDGRLVPHLGFFGADDVCFDDWLVELSSAVSTLATPGSTYVFDEGEQGQPAFEFARDGSHVLFSIVASEIGMGGADPAWQRVTFVYEEFRVEVARFVDGFRTELRRQIPDVWERWWPATVSRT